MRSKLIPTLAAATILGTAAIAGTALAQADAEPTPAPAAATAQWESAERPSPSPTAAPLVEAGTPGLFVPISPYRTYDSRDFDGAALVSLESPTGVALALNILFDQDGFLAIPDTAIAITYNATVVKQASDGFLTVASINQSPGDAIASSTVNWKGPGGPIANGSTVAVGDFDGEPGFIGVLVGGPPSATTDFIIDVTGYYIAAET